MGRGAFVGTDLARRSIGSFVYVHMAKKCFPNCVLSSDGTDFLVDQQPKQQPKPKPSSN